MQPSSGANPTGDRHGSVKSLLAMIGERSISGRAATERAATGAAASIDAADLEQPFLLDEQCSSTAEDGWEGLHTAGSSRLDAAAPGSSRAEAEEDEEGEHQQQREPKQWPALRFGSMTTRRFSPSPFVSDTPPGQRRHLLRSISDRSHSSSGPLTPRLQKLNSAGAPIAAAEQAFGAAATGSSSNGTALGHQSDVTAASAAPAPPQRSLSGRMQLKPVSVGTGGRAQAVIVGLINAVIALPVMFSFAAIIFQNPFFRPLRGSLVKLVMLSSAVHQAVFAAVSTMPFAVGQVQDVGLIFLSAMATDVASDCHEAGVSPEDTTATVLACLTVSTALVGLVIVATGLLRLASLVQYVPLPVVGGYLGFVGLFCFMAGVSLSSGLHFNSLRSFHHLLALDPVIKLLPALALCALLAVVLRRARSPFALPALLVAVPTGFHLLLLVTGVSLQDARDAGWVTQPEPSDSQWKFWQAWSLYNIHSFPPTNIRWSMLLPQAGKLAALFFVVAFGSSMDVAAIQAEAPSDLDYNRELLTVGLSNLAAACAGVGLTGSYIFSQTLFALRMGISSPLMGAIISAFELSVFMLPLNLMAFLPNFFFGGLIMWIGYDIIKDWLFISFKRITGVEYGLLVTTFAAVILLGLEGGIAVGILLSAASFAFSYARVTVTAFTVVPSRSGAVRTFDQRAVLEAFASRIVAASLTGYLFFGSSVTVADKLVAVAKAVLEPEPHLSAADSAAALDEVQTAAASSAAKPDRGSPLDQHPGGGSRVGGAIRGGLRGAISRLKSSVMLTRYDAMDMFLEHQPEQPPGEGSTHAASEQQAGEHRGRLSKMGAALAEAPRFLILDFRRVQGLDATAARSFAALAARLQRLGVQMIIAHTPRYRPSIKRLLMAQGLVLKGEAPAAAGQGGDEGAGSSSSAGAACLWFPTLDAALDYCEERFLAIAETHGICKQHPQSLSLAQILQANLELPAGTVGPAVLDTEAAAAALSRCVQRVALAAGGSLFSCGDPADDFLIIESGAVECVMDYLESTVRSRAVAMPQDVAPTHAARVLRYGPGGIVGEMDFFLHRPRSFSAVCTASGSAWCVSRRAFEEMAREEPGVLVLLQTIILRSTCLSFSHALDALERSNQ